MNPLGKSIYKDIDRVSKELDKKVHIVTELKNLCKQYDDIVRIVNALKNPESRVVLSPEIYGGDIVYDIYESVPKKEKHEFNPCNITLGEIMRPNINIEMEVHTVDKNITLPIEHYLEFNNKLKDLFIEQYSYKLKTLNTRINDLRHKIM